MDEFEFKLKTCSKCHEDINRSFFYDNIKMKDGKNSQCKKCAYETFKAWKKKNPDRYAELQKGYKKKSRAKRPKKPRVKTRPQYFVEIVSKHLTDNHCVDCGESNILVLEFDHRDQRKKLFTITQWKGFKNSEYSVDDLLEEIEKCDIRCANCHRIRTAYQCNSWRLAHIE